MDKRSKRIDALSSKSLKLIGQIDELKGQWVGGGKLNPQALGRLKRSVLITSTGSSTRIEGVKMSDAEVEKFISGLNIQKLVNRDTQEVKGYFELLENIFNASTSIKFNEDTIKHLHLELLKYSDKDERHRGEYKKVENSVEMFNQDGKSIGVVFETTPAYLTSKQMKELVDWTKNAIEEERHHPLLIISNFLVEFLAIHPFQDGNGRLSRILTNLLLLKAGYKYTPYVSHEKIIEDNKSNYYLSLRKSQITLKGSKANIIPWIEFFLNICFNQAKQAIELLSDENIEKILSPKQLLVLQYLKRHADATPKEISDATGVGRPTVSQALEVLLRLKRIERIGQGRTTRYIAISAKDTD